MSPTNPLPSPPTPPPGTRQTVATGMYIPPVTLIRTFSSTQWEEFVLEWASELKAEYARVERCGGAGDLGRDVIAFCANPSDGWDNYQCKHYNHPLRPGDIWIELGKLVYYTFTDEYTYPRKYYFIAPSGVGTKLSSLLKKPAELRNQLISEWDKHCLHAITQKQSVPLDPTLLNYLNGLDFGIFDSVPPLRMITQHSNTRWHVYRFGGGLKPRPAPDTPPQTPQANEMKYVRALLEAYGESVQKTLDLSELPQHRSLEEHFIDTRVEFYSAESLRNFSRDALLPGEFSKIQDEIYSGIRDVLRQNHSHGYARLLATTAFARILQLSGNMLADQVTPRDRGGICHQLVNENKFEWVQKN